VRRLPPLLALLVLLAAAPLRAAAPEGPGWLTERAPPFTFHFRPEDGGVAHDLAGHSARVAADLEARTGLALPRHVDVVLAPDPETFAAVQPGNPPGWAAGTAWSERGEIYLRTRLPRQGADPIQRTFTHEVVHIAVGRAFSDPPRWLNEGLAKVLAGEFDARSHALLARATLSGSLLSLEDITRRWPTHAGHAQLAYAQSTDFVSYLANQGDDALPSLIRRLAAGEELDAALVGATGRGLEELEESWRGRITFWHALIPVVGSSGAVWGLASVLFLVAAWRQRRRFRAQMAALEERERVLLASVPLAPADGWDGEGLMISPPRDENGELLLH
jgi:hypothetical protein